MNIDYNVNLVIVQINKNMNVQIDQSVSFQDLLDIGMGQIKYPIFLPIFEITNLNNQTVTDLNMTIGQLGLKKDVTISIYLYSQAEYQKILEQRKLQRGGDFQETMPIDDCLPPGSQQFKQVEDNRINLIFEIYDGDNRIVQNIKLDQNLTLHDAKEELLVQCGIFNDKRLAVDIDLYQPSQKGQVIFNPQKYQMKLSQLQFENNHRIIGKFRYIGGK